MKAFIQHSSTDGNKMVLQSLVRFMDLKDSVVFTSKTNLNRQHKEEKVVARESLEYYQRRIDTTRIKSIQDFIVDSILDERDGVILATLFPSSMILALNDDENEIKSNNGDGCCDVNFSENVFIVDGQHRMYAMLKVYEDLETNDTFTDEERTYIKNYIEHYRFNCTILVNYDLWEQGQVFVNVNFKQKPVNKSLYYEIFGSVYREEKSEWKRNNIYLAHCLAKTLNEREESPYYKRVKMLGTGDGFISQAFVVEALLPHFKRDGIWEFNSEAENIVPGEYTYFATELLSYFVAIRKLFPQYWPSADATKGTLVCKTTSFGAFSRLMSKIRDKDDNEMVAALRNCTSHRVICQSYVDRVTEKLKPLVAKSEDLFGTNSIFAQGSGRGFEMKLYQYMLEILEKDIFVQNEENQKYATIVNVDTVYELLQDYVYSHVVEDLDCISNHHEIDEISDVEIKSVKEVAGTFIVSCDFTISATLHLDSEDIDGFSMSFPASFLGTFEDNDGKLQLSVDAVTIEVNTDKFYE